MRKHPFGSTLPIEEDAVMELQDGLHMLKPGKLASVVTFLEMLEPPPARPIPPRPDLALHRMERPDPDWYRQIFRAIGQDFLWFSRLQLDDAELAAVLAAPTTEVFALTREGSEIGLLELDRQTSGEVELAFFGLVPDAVGGGAGRWLMDQALRLAWEAPGTRRLFVHTCNLDHPAALAFYVRSGFRPYRYAIDVGDDPRLMGLLPRDTAPSVPLIA